jgi:predicted RNA-binding Zn ribbon-like protein
MTHSDEKTAPARFEIDGDALCLDFANTWGNQADPGSDHLQDYGHLVEFARQTECLTEDAVCALSRTAAENREEAAAVLSFARELRQAIYRLFSSRASSHEVPLEDVERINGVLGEALAHRRLEQRDGGFGWSWIDVAASDLRAPIWPVVESAAVLLTSAELDRVRECRAGDCNWLFLDRSRSGTRRWCSMKSCGNRAKARRHYRRQKEKHDG